MKHYAASMCNPSDPQKMCFWRVLLARLVYLELVDCIGFELLVDLGNVLDLLMENLWPCSVGDLPPPVWEIILADACLK